MNSNPAGQVEVVSFPSDDALARQVAADWEQAVTKAARGGRGFATALSGGRIAKKLYTAMVSQVQSGGISLSGAHFFWADERCVPADDPESNFRLAYELLFAPLKLRDDQIHRIRGEIDPELAAHEAESELRRVSAPEARSQPVLDLVLLGMGEDGHVASLFPNEPVTDAANPAIYRAVSNSPKPPPRRITLGYQAISLARQVWVLVSGSGKQAVLEESLSQEGQTPLARVLRGRDRTRILTDFYCSRRETEGRSEG